MNPICKKRFAEKIRNGRMLIYKKGKSIATIVKRKEVIDMAFAGAGAIIAAGYVWISGIIYGWW